MKKLLVVLGVVSFCGIVMAQSLVNETFGKLMGNEIYAKKIVLDGSTITPTASVSTNATVTKSVAAITATAAVTRQVYTPLFLIAGGTTNGTPIMTNATVAVTIVNGDVVLTNLVLNIP